MTAAAENNSDVTAQMQAILDKQKAAHIKDGPASLALRVDRIDRAVDVVKRYQKEICDAVSSDFGHRSPDATMLTDVAGSIGPLNHAKKHVAKWMKPEKRKVTPAILGLFGAKARVEFQPLGTVGVISPWNFPVNLTFAPLAGIFAAGNRAMIKPSEFTPAVSELMARMFADAYDEAEVATFTGGPAVGEAFSTLPFDHLVFTGATSIARHVMRAASANLVPLTLELGGKSPVLISETADMEVTAARVMNGKTLNAGQICLAPDYVMVPESRADEFVAAATAQTSAMFPTMKDNPDYTSIVNDRHYDRLQGYIADAREKGAIVHEINPANEDFSQQQAQKIPPHIIVNPTEDMEVMKNEIFGPILPVKTYKAMDEAIDYVNDHERPLGLYYFGKDKAEETKVLDNTTSGGVTTNDVVMHVSMEDLPFGGVGPAGMGSYHGIDGFKQFSHKKAIFSQTKMDAITKGMRPPYGEGIKKMIGTMMK